MWIDRKILRIHKIKFAIILFLCLFAIFHVVKPAFAYQENGAYRPFGIGYRHKTVIPIWIVSIIIAIVSYLAILWVLTLDIW
jgi:hypothetical protein